MTRTLRRRLSLLAAVAAFTVAAALAGCGAAHHRTSTSSSTASTTTTATTSRPPAAPTVSYGIGDAQGQFASCAPGVSGCCAISQAHCDLAQMHGYFDNHLFLRLLTPSSAHRVSDVRLFVQYDAAEQWNGSTTAPGCVYSRVLEHPWYDVANGWQPAGVSIDDLLAGIIEARADGLTPVVSIAGYPYASARPSWDPAVPDPTTVSGYWAYRCGVQGILSVLSRLPRWQQPHAYEALNEPDGFPLFRSQGPSSASSCAVGPTPQPDGPAKAACDEVIASRVIHGFAGHGGDPVIAGTFKHPDPAYLAPYVAELARMMKGASFPPVWSVHDYDEVTGAYAGVDAGELAAFDRALATDTGGRARSLWITEAGTVLTSVVRGGDCPATGVDPGGTLGACLNGEDDRQVTDAGAFFALPGVADAVPITHLFWYQFEGAPHWDSGLVDAAGVPRAAYCVFYGRGTCTGSAAAS